jgi:hypothetical protein
MSVGINVKLNDDIYRAAARYFGKGKGKLNRNAFINQAIAFFVKAHERRRLAAAFKRASLADQKDPVLQAELHEFDGLIADGLPGHPYDAPR